MTDTLAGLAKVVRSKNAGPGVLTVDILFEDEAGFRRGLMALTGDAVAGCYGRDAGDVTVVPYPPAFAVKIVMPRCVLAGSPGDGDLYGAQQHAPLLGLRV